MVKNPANLPVPELFIWTKGIYFSVRGCAGHLFGCGSAALGGKIMKGQWVCVTAMVVAWITGGCSDVPTRVGDVCQIDDHCGGAEGSLSLKCDNSIPGGACTVESCTMDNPDTTDVAEDLQSCPEGSRCVREGANLYLCRRACEQLSDCREVIVCGQKCETDDNGVETCSQECKNNMECTPFWDLPDETLKTMTPSPPRACILKGHRFQPTSP
jgi:hypothetical protein